MNKSDRGRTLTAAAALAVVSIYLGGCVDQKKEVALYQKQLDTLPGATLPLPAADEPLTLQQAMRLALKTNDSLGLSGEAYVQALIAEDTAFNTFLPTISLNPSLTESQRQRGQTGPSHSFNIPANASINAFNGFRDEASVDKTSAASEQQRQLLLNEQQTILIDVVTAYYMVLTAERSVMVDQNSLGEQEERVRQSVAQSQLGNGTLLAVSQSESQAAGTRVQLVVDQNKVITTRAALAQLIGVDMTTRPLSDGYEPPQESNRAVEAWLADAEASRQDLLAAAAAVTAAQQQVRIAVGEYYPSVTLDTTYFLYKESQPLRDKISGAVNVNIPIFTAGQIEGDVRNAYSQLRSALLSQDATRKQVADDIRTAYANLQSSRGQVRELRVELQATRDALVQAQAQYSVGSAILLDVLTAQTALLTTQLQLATEEYQNKIDYLNLIRVTGRLNLLVAEPNTRPTTQAAENLETTTPEVIKPSTLPVLP
jgi:outer membrane protein